MKKLIIITLLFTLFSCTTEEEDIKYNTKIQLLEIENCNKLGLQYMKSPYSNYRIICIDKYKLINDCIDKYINGLDEKYNNPDTVSDLKEDDYSQVVKTCNEIFGTK